MGQDRVRHLIDELRCHVDGFAQNANMGVGIHKAGQHAAALRVKNLLPVGEVRFVHRADSGDFPVFKGDKTVLIGVASHCENAAMNNFHRRLLSEIISWDSSIISFGRRNENIPPF